MVLWAGLAAPLAAMALVAPAAAPPVVGLHVPWAAGGQHFDERGQLTDAAEAWPDFTVPALRLWDTHTTWADLEPTDDEWSFAHLDEHLDVARAHGTTDVLLVLGGTPAWAAVDPQAAGAPWLPRGSASPPRDLDEWREYVRMVATRYAGRIGAYQIGNEPNVDWFWQGSRADLTRLVRTAAEEIHRADPGARVIGAAPLVSTPASAIGAARWWRALEGTGIDTLALQWYPRKGVSPSALVGIVERLRVGVEGTDLDGLPVWITEVNHRRGSPTGAGGLVQQTMQAAQRSHVQRVYWYAWTRIGTHGLLDLGPGTSASRALRSYPATRR